MAIELAPQQAKAPAPAANYNTLPAALKNRMGKGYRKDWKPTPRLQSPFDTCTDGTGALNGLGHGMSVLVGEAGGGKSTMAKTAAIETAKLGIPVLYVYSESYEDADSLPDDLPNLHKMDYVSFLPKSQKAIEQVFGKFNEATQAVEVQGVVSMLGAKLVVIDSVTTFLAGTSKAVAEADVRDGAFDLNKLGEKLGVAILGISQVRGSGQYQSYAGGAAVGHSGMAVIDFSRHEIDADWDVATYNSEKGSVVYTMRVRKDRTGKSNSTETFIINYTDEFEPVLTTVSSATKAHAAKVKAEKEAAEASENESTDDAPDEGA